MDGSHGSATSVTSSWAPRPARESFNLDGRPAAGIAVSLLPEANPGQVAGEVHDKMEALKGNLPRGSNMSSRLTRPNSSRLPSTRWTRTLIEAAVLVLVVIRAVPAGLAGDAGARDHGAGEPIIGPFAAMAAFGFTVNLSTLFAVILADRHRGGRRDRGGGGRGLHTSNAGCTPHDASVRAMDELFGPIIGITLVLMSVFVPAAFLPGLTGRMYAQFAMVIAATALISAVNAVTLKPTQCALWLRTPVPPEQRNFIFRGFNAVYEPLERRYGHLIGRMTRHAG